MRLFQMRSTLVCNSKTKPKTESMKLQLYKNIDCVQIDVKAGVSEYFLPQNVDWADKKVDKLVVYGSAPESGELSPIDGVKNVYDTEQIQSIYFDLYNQDGEAIAHSLSAVNILHTNNNPLYLDSKLSLQLSRMCFSKTPDGDGCVLIYVFWNSIDIEKDDLPNQNVTVSFDVPANTEVTLSKVIDTYIHSQSKSLKGIIVWGVYTEYSGLFITLRDYNYQTITKLLPARMCRPPMCVGNTPDIGLAYQAESAQVHSMLFDCADVDFDNSVIYNSYDMGVDSNLTITFLY